MIMVTVYAEWWTLILGTILPAVVALVRARWGSSRLGALLLVGLAVLTAVASEIIVDSAGDATFSWEDVGKRFVLLFVVAVVAHYGLLKPTGITGSDGAVARAVPGGLGDSSDAPPAPETRTAYSSGSTENHYTADETGRYPPLSHGDD